MKTIVHEIPYSPASNLHQSMRPYPELLRKLSQEEFQQVIW